MLEVQGPRTQRGVAGGNKRLQSKQTDNESSLFEVKVVLEQVVRRRHNDRASVLEVHEASRHEHREGRVWTTTVPTKTDQQRVRPSRDGGCVGVSDVEWSMVGVGNVEGRGEKQS